MVVSVVLDVVLRPREQRARRRLRWLVHPIRAVKRLFAPFGRFREIVHHAPQARSHRSAVRIDDRHGHTGVRPPAAAHAGGLRRHVREVRPDRLDPYRPPAPGSHDRAVRPAGLSAPGAGRRHPSGDRSRARRNRRGGVRVLRLGAVGGRLHRPDAPGHAARRRAGGGEGATPGHRGHRRPRCRGAAHGGQHARAARRGSTSGGRERAGRRADRVAPARARLHGRGRQRRGVPEPSVARRWA